MIIVTGGSGFLGSHLVRRLAAAGERVTSLDLVAPTSVTGPRGAEAAPVAAFARVDVRDVASLRQTFERAQATAVVHAAALLPNAVAAAIESVNVGGTRAVLEAARTAGVARVVFVSSTAVFAEEGPSDEDGPLVGRGPYAESKQRAEALCRAAREAGLPVAIVRIVPTVGPGRLALFGILFEWVREGRRLPMIGAGANRHQLLDVDDASGAIETLLRAPLSSLGVAFNAGAAETGTVREDLERLCAAAGTGARPIATPAHLAAPLLRLLYRFHLSPVHPRVFETARHDALVPTLRLEALGWRPRHSSADALVRAYRWYEALPEPARRAHGSGHGSAWSGAALSIVKHLF